MNFIKRLFCKHKYELCQPQYAKLGWERCILCGKEKYTGCGCESTEFNFGEIRVK